MSGGNTTARDGGFKASRRIQHRHHGRIVLGLSVLVASLAFPGAGRATAESDLGQSSDCLVRHDSDLRASGVETADGYYEHETWIAARGPQETVRALGATLEKLFPGGSSQVKQAGPSASLESGLIGATVDHHQQEYVVVVDPARVDSAVVAAALSSAATRALSLSASAAPVSVEVRLGCFSASELLEADQVISARTWHPRAKLVTFGSRLSADDSRFHVAFWEKDRDVADGLKSALGDRVVIEFGQPQRRDNTRDADTAPHWGGAAIGLAPLTATCTSGFTAILQNGVRGSVTAGHCNYPDGSDLWSGTNNYGRADEEPGYPTYDMMRIQPNGQVFAHTIHADPCCPDSRTVTGRAKAVLNEYICSGGMVTRSVCGVRVDDLNARFCDLPDSCTPALLHATKPGAVVGTVGDSGGTIYVRPTTTTAHIRGIHIAGRTPDEVYAEHVTYIESHLNLTVGSDTLAGSAATSGLGSELLGYDDQAIMSNDGRFRAVMQSDGNFVIYDFGSAIWSTQTFGSGLRAVHQKDDGNFVIYNGDTAVWASSWHGQTQFGTGFRLLMQGDGNLVNRNAANEAVWASGTNR